MKMTTGSGQIRYESLVQDALRSVARQVLLQVVKDGLPGDHHFYITFQTRHEGVEISDRLASQYPEEMTIVVQHQYWGLEVTDDLFSIQLSFQKHPETLTVPFAALTAFVDPSVQFGLQFVPNDEQVVRSKGAIAELAMNGVAEEPTDDEDRVEESSVGDVVSLDAFRKKT